MTVKREGPIVFSEIKANDGLKKALEIGKEAAIEVLKNSNLRGRGGAGFPTGLKWGFTANSNADKKYIVCNADEGEPGTFKDRVLLSEYARLVFEGMVIGAFSVGAEEGFLYLRGEYKLLLPCLEKILNVMRQENVLGRDILGKKGFNFDICIRLGSGAYVCGEETALIESLEGHRGEPRNRPPFPVNNGYNCCPTAINNAETFAVVTQIIAKGADWFKFIGTDKSAGSKLLSISGDCRKPGVYEVPFGVTIKQILKLVQAEDSKAVQVGGASGVCIPKAQFSRKISFEDLSTGGSIIIFNQKREMLKVADNFLKFFKEESCGQCTPCREGIPVLLEAIEELKRNECSGEYLKDIFSLTETMQLASKCGLGQSCPNAFVSILNNFPKEYKLSKTIKKEKKFNE